VTWKWRVIVKCGRMKGKEEWEGTNF